DPRCEVGDAVDGSGGREAAQKRAPAYASSGPGRRRVDDRAGDRGSGADCRARTGTRATTRSVRVVGLESAGRDPGRSRREAGAGTSPRKIPAARRGRVANVERARVDTPGRTRTEARTTRRR